MLLHWVFFFFLGIFQGFLHNSLIHDTVLLLWVKENCHVLINIRKCSLHSVNWGIGWYLIFESKVNIYKAFICSKNKKMSSRKGISTRRNSVCIKTMDTNTKCMHVEFVSSRLFGHLKEGTTHEIDTYIHSSPRSANYFKDSQSVLVIFF